MAEHPDRPPTVFLSHTTRDERDHALALTLAERLRALSADVWIAPQSIPAGADWQEAIVNQILTKCSHFFIIVSAASEEAEWVEREIELARRASQAKPLVILPLFVGQVEDSEAIRFLRQFQQVPFHHAFEEQVKEVARALALEYARPPAAPAIADAVAYLQRCIQRDLQAMRDFKWLRAVSPLAGLVVAAVLTARYLGDIDGLPTNVVLATFAGMPAVTTAIGTAVHFLLTQGERASVALAQELEDGITSCPDAESPDCRGVWSRFTWYRDKRLNLASRRMPEVE